MAIIAVALLATGLLGCAPQQEVAGATPGVVATPRATPTPRVTPTPMGTPIPPAAAIPEPITRALANVYANVNSFEGTVAVTFRPDSPTPISSTMRHWFKQPGMNRLEVTQSSPGGVPVGTTIVSDGQTFTLYDPDENQVTEIQNIAQLALFLNLPQERLLPAFQILQAQQFLSSLSPQANVAIVGTDTVANRATTVVEITPAETTPRFERVRLWLDNQTQVPLRAQALGRGDRALINIEYSQFDPTAPVADDLFTFTPPAGAQVVRPTPDQVPAIAGFQSATLEEAQKRAGFPLLQPATLPAGLTQQAIGTSTFNSATAVAFFYGTAQELSTVLIEKPAAVSLPPLRGAETITLDAFSAEVYQTPEMVVVDWVQGDTALTLASTLPREQVLDIARSVR